MKKKKHKTNEFIIDDMLDNILQLIDETEEKTGKQMIVIISSENLPPEIYLCISAIINPFILN